MGTRDKIPPGVKRPGREAYYSHLAPRLRMRWAISPLPQYVFTAWCLRLPFLLCKVSYLVCLTK